MRCSQRWRTDETPREHETKECCSNFRPDKMQCILGRLSTWRQLIVCKQIRIMIKWYLWEVRREAAGLMGNVVWVRGERAALVSVGFQSSSSSSVGSWNIKCDSDLLMIKIEACCSKSALLSSQQQAGILKHSAAGDLFWRRAAMSTTSVSLSPRRLAVLTCLFIYHLCAFLRLLLSRPSSSLCITLSHCPRSIAQHECSDQV